MEPCLKSFKRQSYRNFRGLSSMNRVMVVLGCDAALGPLHSSLVVITVKVQPCILGFST